MPEYKNALEDSLGPGALEKFEKVASSNMHDMNNYATMLYKNFCKLMLCYIFVIFSNVTQQYVQDYPNAQLFFYQVL